MNSSALTTKTNSTAYSLLMWSCAAVFYLYQFVIRVSPSVMTGELQSALSIEACALGTLTSFYYYGYVGAQIPVGVMLDRIGVRFPLTSASLLCLLGCVLFISTENLLIMSVGRFLMGAGSAFGFLSALKLATLWLPVNRFAFFIGLTLLLGTSGGAAAGAPLSFLIDYIGWKQSIVVLAVVSAVIAISTFLIVKDHETHKKPEDGKRSHEFKIIESMKMVLSNPQSWIIGAYGCLMYIPLSGFADLWGVPYVMSVFNVEKAEAAGSVSMFYIGVGIGAPLTAVASDYFKSLNKPILWGALLTFLFMGAALYCTALPFYFTYGIFLFAGMASSVQFLAFATVTNVNPSSISGTSTAIHNMLCMMSGIIVQPLIGFVLDYFARSNSESIPGVSYSQSDYKMALLIVPFSLLLSVGFALFIKEAYQTEA